MDELRAKLVEFLGADAPPTAIEVRMGHVVQTESFLRHEMSFLSDGEWIDGLWFEPARKSGRAVVALHQHNSQWHLGKSEIAGLAGDPLQAFGPALARGGVSVLAFDAIGFESRRGSVDGDTVAVGAPGLNPARGAAVADWLQYYNHAMHRLVRGELLMRQALREVAGAVSALETLAETTDVGVLGHSSGGNVALFAAALIPRIRFAVCSGALCSYRHKLRHGVALEMALAIPGFARHFDFEDLVACVAPRRVLVVSSEGDPLTADASDIVARARETFVRSGATGHLQHVRTSGSHALDQPRFEAIVRWVETGVSAISGDGVS